MEKLLTKHGGYRKLKTFQLSQLIFDITTRFCSRFIHYKSRTNDQMVQAARSGVQNIAEGSQASGTSKKTEIKLTNVARASFEELKLDYQDFLRQRKLNTWEKGDPRGNELVRLRLDNADDFVRWAMRLSQETGESIEGVVANGMLTLLSVTCSLLDRQIAAQAKAFENDGGFTERLYRVRTQARNKLD